MVASLYPQQREALHKMIEQRGGVVWMRVGTGKTRIGIFAAIELTDVCGILVICRRAAFSDWANEIATLQLISKVVNVEDTAINQTFNEPTFVLVSEGMLLNDTIVEVIESLIRWNQIGAIIIDEGYLFKNPRGVKHSRIMALRRELPTIVLSGSIMPARDLVDIYGQVAISGHGKELAKHLTSFREQFLTGIQGRFFAWYPKRGAYKKIMERILPFTYVYMPRKTERTIKESILKVDVSEQQLDYFRELKQFAAIEGKFVLKNITNIAIKAQQISDGWIKRDDEGIEWFDSPKLDRCIALVQEIIAGGDKVVVWCAFREDIKRIGERLEMPIATLQSGKRFDADGWNKGKYKVCVGTMASGSSINYFAQVPYGIYFSQDVKWLSLQQSQGRHDRRSSEHDTCYFTFLHTERSLDALIHYIVRHSKTVEAGLIDNMEVMQWLKDVH